MPGMIGRSAPTARGALDERDVVAGAQHHLGDRELRTGVVLGLEHARVLVEVRGVDVALGEGGDADAHVGALADQRDQLVGVA